MADSGGLPVEQGPRGHPGEGNLGLPRSVEQPFMQNFAPQPASVHFQGGGPIATPVTKGPYEDATPGMSFLPSPMIPQQQMPLHQSPQQQMPPQQMPSHQMPPQQMPPQPFHFPQFQTQHPSPQPVQQPNEPAPFFRQQESFAAQPQSQWSQPLSTQQQMQPPFFGGHCAGQGLSTAFPAPMAPGGFPAPMAPGAFPAPMGPGSFPAPIMSGPGVFPQGMTPGIGGLPPNSGDEPMPVCICGEPALQLAVRKEGQNQGRLFYKCAKPQGEGCDHFQWADEPPRAAQPQGADVPPEGPPCMCGAPSNGMTVRKEGPNTGRVFFCCRKQREEPGRCNFFQWADEPPRAPQVQGADATPAGPPCSCGTPSNGMTVRKEGPNTGRVFYCCPKQREEPGRCNFFQWADEGPRPPSPPCNCGGGMLSNSRSVAKEGPNKGRPFFCCSQPQPGCGFFQWGDEEPGQGDAQRGVATPARDRAGDVCYKCNQSGHWASNCPNEAGGKGGKGDGGAQGSSGACFKCNEPGHWASNCPNEAGGKGGGGRGKSGKGRGRGRGNSQAAHTENDFGFFDDRAAESYRGAPY